MKLTIALLTATFLFGASTLTAATVQENYDKHCTKCHGADGKGQTKMGKKLGAKDYTDAKVQTEFTDERAFKSIKEGMTDKNGKTIKKAFGEELTEAEIKELVAFIRTFAK
jgi:cytochrome c6